MTEGVHRTPRRLSGRGEVDVPGFSPCFSAASVVHSFSRQLRCETLAGRPGLSLVSLSPGRFGGDTAIA